MHANLLTKSVQDGLAQMLTYDVSHMKISVVQLWCCACLLWPGAVVGEGCAGSLRAHVKWASHPLLQRLGSS